MRWGRRVIIAHWIALVLLAVCAVVGATGIVREKHQREANFTSVCQQHGGYVYSLHDRMCLPSGALPIKVP